MREIKKLQSCPEHSVSHSSLLFLLLALYYVSGGEYPESHLHNSSCAHRSSAHVVGLFGLLNSTFVLIAWSALSAKSQTRSRWVLLPAVVTSSE